MPLSVLPCFQDLVVMRIKILFGGLKNILSLLFWSTCGGFVHSGKMLSNNK